MSEMIAPTADPSVTIVIPCRNEAHNMDRCLQSVMGQAFPAGGLEVIVADGMSGDGTRELVRRLMRKDPRVRLIDNPLQIVSAALNAAIRASLGKVIIRMDAHTEYAPDYVSQCLAVLEQTGADNVGGPARTRAVGYTDSAVAAAYHSPFAVGGARFHDREYEGYLDTVTYGCWHREAFEQFGYFDEELVRNQDDEHNLRIIRKGGTVYQSPRIQSWYRPRNSLRALFRQYMQYGYWKVRVIQKHRLPASWRHLVPGGFALTLGTLALTSLLGFLTSDLCALSAILWRPAAWLLFGLLGLYGACVGAASLHAANKNEWKLLPLLPLVFWCYHFGYGLCFLRGVWNFVIRRKGPAGWAAQLTREENTSAPEQQSRNQSL